MVPSGITDIWDDLTRVNSCRWLAWHQTWPQNSAFKNNWGRQSVIQYFELTKRFLMSHTLLGELWMSFASISNRFIILKRDCMLGENLLWIHKRHPIAIGCDLWVLWRIFIMLKKRTANQLKIFVERGLRDIWSNEKEFGGNWGHSWKNEPLEQMQVVREAQIGKFMGPTWGPPGTLLSGRSDTAAIYLH